MAWEHPCPVTMISLMNKYVEKTGNIAGHEFCQVSRIRQDELHEEN
jgi:hypothetical protein